MRVSTTHSSKELLFRARIALDKQELIELVECHRWPSGAQKAAKKLGHEEREAYSVWALAALKRDYHEIYIQAVMEWTHNQRTASTGNAEKKEAQNEVAI